MKNTESTPRSNTYIYPFLVIVLLVFMAVLLAKQENVASIPENFVAAWTEMNSMLIPRRALTAIKVNNYIYSIGGIDKFGQYVKQAEFAKILANGHLSTWQLTSSLNQGRFYLAAAAANGYIYAIGGGIGPPGSDNQATAIVEKAKILENGALGPWQIDKEMISARRGLKVVSNHNTLYALGGYNGIFLKSIEQTRVSDTGTLSEWELSSEESLVDRYIHSAAIHDNTIYLLGGHVSGKNKMSYGDVEKAKINPDGTLLPWQIEKTKLRMPRFIASAIALNDYIYLLAGHNGGNRLKQVEFSRKNKSGKLHRWEFTSPLIYERSAAAVVTTTVKNAAYIYIIGGMGKSGPLNNVEMAMQFSNGQLGRPLP